MPTSLLEDIKTRQGQTFRDKELEQVGTDWYDLASKGLVFTGLVAAYVAQVAITGDPIPKFI
jgi:hypothetical protein